MPPLITATEYLEINSIPLATPAWRILDLSLLLDDAPPVGDNTGMPHANGRRPEPRYGDELEYVFPILVNGGFQSDGSAPSGNDDRMQLTTNVEYLKANLGGAADPDDDSLLPAIWHRRDGSTRIADVQVAGPFNLRRKFGTDGPYTRRGTLDVTNPSGIWVPP